ncbi:hypothetical protein CC2G_006687 [Coprinopsis cinerea AmutBmut pab1-1]|nr:hypothetical protein CC2G_006687 [Coprinopsis cinerea AmutBmut pab1-1]
MHAHGHPMMSHSSPSVNFPHIGSSTFAELNIFDDVSDPRLMKCFLGFEPTKVPTADFYSSFSASYLDIPFLHNLSHHTVQSTLASGTLLHQLSTYLCSSASSNLTTLTTHAARVKELWQDMVASASTTQSFGIQSTSPGKSSSEPSTLPPLSDDQGYHDLKLEPNVTRSHIDLHPPHPQPKYYSSMSGAPSHPNDTIYSQSLRNRPAAPLYPYD